MRHFSCKLYFYTWRCYIGMLYTMSGSWKKGSDQCFPWETWSVNYEWYWETGTWSCVDTLYFRLGAEKMFFMKILLMLPKFHEKTLSSSGYIKIFCRGKRMYMYILSPSMDAVLNEERQLMKRVGIFQGGVWLKEIFRAKIFLIISIDYFKFNAQIPLSFLWFIFSGSFIAFSYGRSNSLKFEFLKKSILSLDITTAGHASEIFWTFAFLK